MHRDDERVGAEVDGSPDGLDAEVGAVLAGARRSVRENTHCRLQYHVTVTAGANDSARAAYGDQPQTCTSSDRIAASTRNPRLPTVGEGRKSSERRQRRVLRPPTSASVGRRHAVSADREIEPYVLTDLRGPPVDAAPAHEANREPVLARADLGEHAARWRAAGRERGSPGRCGRSECWYRPPTATRGAASVASRVSHSTSATASQIGLMWFVQSSSCRRRSVRRQMQPIAVVGQIEHAGAARDRRCDAGSSSKSHILSMG